MCGDEEGRSLVGFPDFPTAHTDGADTRKVVEEAIDCLGSSIAFAIAGKANVPKPSRLKRDLGMRQSRNWLTA